MELVSSVELPREYVDVSVPLVTGQSIYVAAGDNLQAAINAAQLGDEIVLQAGATFVGSFTLPVKSGEGWITIRSDGPLPPPGTRVTADDAGAMATILASGSNVAALSTMPGAHHYHIIGVEFSAAPGVNQMTSLINLGSGNPDQDTLAEQPHHIILDRVYVHGTETLDLRRGIALNSAETAIVDSYISEIHSTADSQAIAGWNGTGPYLIQNNYLEAAGENIMFGGADPQIPNALPGDIVIRGNDFFKPLDWQGVWLVKNLLELKIGLRVLIEDNNFENNWVDGQSGFAIVFKSTNQNGSAPWSQTADVTFRNNVVQNSASGLNIAGSPETHDAVTAARFLISNNLFTEIGNFAGTQDGRMFQLLGATDVIIENNTAIHNISAGTTITFDGDPTLRLVFQDNIVTHGQYGIMGSGASEGAATLDAYAPDAAISGNVFIGASAGRYGGTYADNYFPATLSDVGFIDPTNGNYQLNSDSRFRTAGAKITKRRPLR